MQTARMMSLMKMAIITLQRAEDRLVTQPVLSRSRVIRNFPAAVDAEIAREDAIKILQACRTELELALETIDEYESVFNATYAAPFLVSAGA